MRRFVRRALHAAAIALTLVLFVPIGLVGRLRTSRRRRRGERPVIVRGPVPIVSIHYAARADRLRGYRSETIVYGTYRISARGLFDHDLSRWRSIPLLGQLVPYAAFLWALTRYDLFVFFFDGGLLGETPAWRLEPRLLRVAGKRIVAYPYGGDARLASRTRAIPGWHAYSDVAPGDEDRREADVAERLDVIGRGADAVLGCADLVEDLPRLDGLFSFPIDLDEWQPSPAPNGDVVRVVHAPNHPHYKGTRYVEEAVALLQAEGEPVELVLVQGVPGDEARRLYEQADIVVDQLLIGAYAQFAIECMASRPAGRLLPQPALRGAPSGVGEAPIVSRDARHDRRGAARARARPCATRGARRKRPGVRAPLPLARSRRRATGRGLPQGLGSVNGGLRRLAWQVLVYGAGRLGLQLFSLITLPVMTRVFVPAQYGIIETISAFASVVVIVATLSLNSAVQRSYFDYTGEQVPERRTVVSTGFWATAGWSLAICLALVPLARPLSQLFFGTEEYWELIALAMLALPLTVGITYFQDVLRLLQQPGRYVAISFLFTGLTVVFVLWLVLVEDQGLRGVYLGGLLATPVPLLVSWWLVRRTLAFDFSRPELRLMLAYALPLLPVAAAAWVMQFADRFFILHYADAAEVGLYGVAVRLSNVLMLAVIAFAVAWAPFILDLHSRDADAERVVRARAFAAVGVGLGFGAVCLGVWSREFFRTITDPSFEDAYKSVGLLLGAVVALGLNGVTMTAISITRQTKYFALYAAYTSVLNIALNFLLIPPFGMVGAAAASFATTAAPRRSTTAARSCSTRRRSTSEPCSARSHWPLC